MVTTITTNVYTSGRSPDYLWLTRGGVHTFPVSHIPPGLNHGTLPRSWLALLPSNAYGNPPTHARPHCTALDGREGNNGREANNAVFSDMSSILPAAGMLSTPDGMGSLAVGSFTGKDQIKWDTTQTGSEDYTAVMFSFHSSHHFARMSRLSTRLR